MCGLGVSPVDTAPVAAGIGLVWGTDPVVGIGRLGAGPSCGCS